MRRMRFVGIQRQIDLPRARVDPRIDAPADPRPDPEFTFCFLLLLAPALPGVSRQPSFTSSTYRKGTEGGGEGVTIQ